MADVVQGLALYIVGMGNYNALFFNVLYGENEATVGVGKLAPGIALPTSKQI